jgi:hypothetical protein
LNNFISIFTFFWRWQVLDRICSFASHIFNWYSSLFFLKYIVLIAFLFIWLRSFHRRSRFALFTAINALTLFYLTFGPILFDRLLLVLWIFPNVFRRRIFLVFRFIVFHFIFKFKLDVEIEYSLLGFWGLGEQVA